MPANSPQGWQAPTLRREAGQWRIYCDSGAAFVLLDKACEELVAACPGGYGRLLRCPVAVA